MFDPNFYLKENILRLGINLNHPGGVPGGIEEEGREVSTSGGEAPIRRDDD